MLVEIPAGPAQAIAELDLSPPEQLVRSGRAEADLRLLFTKRNRVIVQDVYVQPFTENVAPAVLTKLSENIVGSLRDRWPKSPVFKVVTTRLTCIPDSGCRFTWLRVSFELGNEADNAMRPIACTLYPASSQDAVKLKSSVEISGELTVQVAKTGMKQVNGIEHDRYEYNINAYGAFSSSPAWDFQKTPVHPQISGDLALLMVIASAAEISSSGQIQVSARAELEGGSLVIPLITRRTAENAAAVTFTI